MEVLIHSQLNEVPFMEVHVFRAEQEMAAAAADEAAERLAERIRQRGHATFMAATGLSQAAFLEALTRHHEVDWRKTEMFHLDEYVGLPETHPASFRRYLRERFIEKVHPGTVHLIDGNAADPARECARLGTLVRERGIDIAFAGIGENGHLAFNDPPANFETEAPFLVVTMDDACRAQQVGEGWFKRPEEVPRQAITVSIRELLRATCILSVVPGARKAEAVRCAVEGPVTPSCPASVLNNHPDTHLFLDAGSASLLVNEGTVSTL